MRFSTIPLANRLRRWALFALSIPAFTACEFYDYSDTEPVATERPLVDFAFPNALGNRWEYLTTTEAVFSTHRTLSEVPSTLVLQRRETLPGGTYADVLSKTDYYAGGQTVVNETFYTNTTTGLLEHGYTLGDHTVFLKNGTQAPTYRHNGLSFSHPGELFARLHHGGTAPANKTDGSIVLHYQPFVTLGYNAFLLDEWTFGANANNTAASLKRIVGTEWVETPFGGLTTVKISLRYDLDGNGYWDPGVEAFQYWSPEGLVRTEYHAYGVQEYDPATNTYRLADFHQVTLLQDYALR